MQCTSFVLQVSRFLPVHVTSLATTAWVVTWCTVLEELERTAQQASEALEGHASRGGQAQL
eukprot:1125669-Amphidinium_carterae.1